MNSALECLDQRSIQWIFILSLSVRNWTNPGFESKINSCKNSVVEKKCTESSLVHIIVITFLHYERLSDKCH